MQSSVSLNITKINLDYNLVLENQFHDRYLSAYHRAKLHDVFRN